MAVAAGNAITEELRRRHLGDRTLRRSQSPVQREQQVTVWPPPISMATTCADVMTQSPEPPAPRRLDIAWQMHTAPSVHVRSLSPLSPQAQQRGAPGGVFRSASTSTSSHGFVALLGEEAVGTCANAAATARAAAAAAAAARAAVASGPAVRRASATAIADVQAVARLAGQGASALYAAQEAGRRAAVAADAAPNAPISEFAGVQADAMLQAAREVACEDRFWRGCMEARVEAVGLQAEAEEQSWRLTLKAQLTDSQAQVEHWRQLAGSRGETIAVYEALQTRDAARTKSWQRLCEKRLEHSFLQEAIRRWSHEAQQSKRQKHWESQVEAMQTKANADAARWLTVEKGHGRKAHGLVGMVSTRSMLLLLHQCWSAWVSAVTEAMRAREAGSHASRARLQRQARASCAALALDLSAGRTAVGRRLHLAPAFGAWCLFLELQQHSKRLVNVKRAGEQLTLRFESRGQQGNLHVILSRWCDVACQRRYRGRVKLLDGIEGVWATNQQWVVFNSWHRVVAESKLQAHRDQATRTVMWAGRQTRRQHARFECAARSHLLGFVLSSWSRNARREISHRRLAASERRRRLGLDRALRVWGYDDCRRDVEASFVQWRTYCMAHAAMRAREELVSSGRRALDNVREERRARFQRWQNGLRRTLHRQRCREGTVLPLWVVFRVWHWAVGHELQASIVASQLAFSFRRLEHLQSRAGESAFDRAQKVLCSWLARQCFATWSQSTAFAKKERSAIIRRSRCWQAVEAALACCSRSQLVELLHVVTLSWRTQVSCATAVARHAEIAAKCKKAERDASRSGACVQGFLRMLLKMRAAMQMGTLLGAWRLAGHTECIGLNASLRSMLRRSTVHLCLRLYAHKNALCLLSCLAGWRMLLLFGRITPAVSSSTCRSVSVSPTRAVSASPARTASASPTRAVSASPTRPVSASPTSAVSVSPARAALSHRSTSSSGPNHLASASQPSSILSAPLRRSPSLGVDGHRNPPSAIVRTSRRAHTWAGFDHNSVVGGARGVMRT